MQKKPFKKIQELSKFPFVAEHWLVQDNLSARLPVCPFARRFVRMKLSAIISSKGVFDLLISMVPSEFRQNVPFGRYKYFWFWPPARNVLHMPSQSAQRGCVTCWLRWCHQKRVIPSRSAATSTLRSEIKVLPNTMKIESRMPQTMDNPTVPTFGRIDASRGS